MAVLQTLRHLDRYPVEPSDDSLIDATRARIARAEREQAQRMRLDPVERLSGSGLRLRRADLITAAAMILVAVGVGTPILSAMRQTSFEAACANNLRVAGNALHAYASDYDNSMPVMAGFGSLWSSRQGTDHLRLLPTLGYCDRGHLVCPGHCSEGPAYSYQAQAPGQRLLFGNGPIIAILGDRNPVLDATRSGQPVNVLAGTSNHAGRGQNILCSDGVVMFLSTPLLQEKDNVWLPRNHGGPDVIPQELAPEPDDSFLVHPAF